MTPSDSGPATSSFTSIAQAEFAARFGRPEGSWRLRIYTIIFESDTRAGRLFDLLLILTILASVMVVILDSVQSITAAMTGFSMSSNGYLRCCSPLNTR